MTEQHNNSSESLALDTVTPEMVDAYLLEARRLRAQAVSDTLSGLVHSLFQKSGAQKARPSAPVSARPVGAAG